MSSSSYEFVLKSDKEILDEAVAKYSLEDSLNASTGLDSTLFGANTTRNNVCYVCKKNIEQCPGHYSVMELPIPIVKAISKSDCLRLLTCLCPICSHLLLPEETIDKIKKLDGKFRLKATQEAVKSYLNGFQNAMITCPNCHEQITSPITMMKYKYSFVPVFTIKSPASAEFEILNPIFAYNVLQNFVQIEEVGFSEDWHPKNFMTSYIPIIPTKLRAKSTLNGIDTSSAITGYYKIILDDAIPELLKIKNYCVDKKLILIDKSQTQKFLYVYSLLMAFYLLIVDMGSDRTQEEISAFLNEPNQIYKKKYKINFDPNNSMLRRFKGKERSIFSKGLIRMIHDMCARIVLGAAMDAKMTELVVPYDVGNSLMIFYPVFKENLQFMKELVHAMTNKELLKDRFVPKVYGVWKRRTSSFQKLTNETAVAIAQFLKPGDKIGISLCNNDFVIQSRHPALREQSLTSFLVRKDIVPTMNIPITVCEIKQADYDGDECQLYLSSSHVDDIEHLLLHSVGNQLRSFDNGNLSFFYSSSHDDDLGISRVGNFDISFHNHQAIPKQNVLNIIESFLPKGLTYISNELTIRDGKIDKEKCNFRYKPFYKYLVNSAGDMATIKLMDNLSQLAYDINRVVGATLGFEIRFWGSEKERSEIRAKVQEAIKLASENIKKDGFASVLATNEIERIKPSIQTTLLEAAKGQSIDSNRYTKNRSAEYYTMVVLPNWVNIEGDTVHPELVEGTRVSSCGYRYSIDPVDYGCVDVPVIEDKRQVSQFFSMMEEMKGIYNRAMGTAKAGYLSNRMTVLFERAYTDYNGCLTDGEVLLSPQYGVCGIGSKIEFQQPLKDLALSQQDFKAKYSDKRLVELHKYINENIEAYKNITSFIAQETSNTFETGFDFEQYFITKTTGKTPQNEIDKFIEEIYNVYRPPALSDSILKLEENFIDHEFYFRQKLTEYKLDNKMKEEIKLIMMTMFTDAGECVGIKSALAASAPLTQSLLSAIHNASAGGATVDLVIRSAGYVAFDEQLSGGRCKGDGILTIVLIDDSYESCIKFALEQETFYFNEIWCENTIRCSRKISDDLVKIYGKEILKVNRHPYYVVSTWNMIKISKYGIRISEIITNLMANHHEIKMMIPYRLNDEQVNVNIYFKESLDSQDIFNAVQKWKSYHASNIIHGKYLKNCFVTENRNKPGHFLIEANEMEQIVNFIYLKSKKNINMKIKSHALQNLIFDPRVDPTLCKTTVPDDNIKLFGVCEGECRHYDRLLYTAQNLSDTSSCLHRIYKTITSIMTARGKLTYASGNSLQKDPYADPMTSVKFQEAGKFIRNACIKGKQTNIHQQIPALIFGEESTMGTGVSKIMMYNKAE